MQPPICMGPKNETRILTTYLQKRHVQELAYTFRTGEPNRKLSKARPVLGGVEGLGLKVLVVDQQCSTDIIPTGLREIFNYKYAGSLGF